MSDCCSSSCDTPEKSSAPKKHTCPANGKLYSAVDASTISHHLKEPWRWQAEDQGYYFCADPECDVVYFAEDNSVIEKSALREVVGVKERQPESLVCYCYGVSFQEAESNAEAKAFVMQKTKAGECACDTRNPSGRCCLKDFP